MDLLWGVSIVNTAILQMNYPDSGLFGQHLMAGHNYGAAGVVKVGYVPEYRSCVIRVKVAGRLIGKDNLRTIE